MRTARKRKGRVFKVRVCRHCGRRTRGPAHFRHEQACGSQVRNHMSAGRRRRNQSVSQRRRSAPRTSPMVHFFEQLRGLVQQEIQRQLGVAL